MKYVFDVFNMLTGKNESKILTKETYWEFKYKFDERKCNSKHKWNNDKCWCKCKDIYMWKKYIWNPAICNCKNRKYLASIIDNSVIMCDEIMEETKIIPKNFNEKSNL